MSQPHSEAELLGATDKEDQELLALPKPRRPGRRLTLVLMAVTGAAAATLALGLQSEAAFALRGGSPLEIGDLSKLEPRPELINAWVHAKGTLSADRAASYSRPLESGSYRLAPIAGNDKLWVQVRVLPADAPFAPHFIAPDSFVGRLIPARAAGVRHIGLTDAPADAGIGPMPQDAWLLLDGEAPSTTRWALALVTLLAGFTLFNIYGLARLLRPVRD